MQPAHSVMALLEEAGTSMIMLVLLVLGMAAAMALISVLLLFFNALIVVGCRVSQWLEKTPTSEWFGKRGKTEDLKEGNPYR